MSRKIGLVAAVLAAIAGLSAGCSGMPPKPSAYPLDQRPVAAVMDFDYRASATDFKDTAAGLAESVSASLASTQRLKLVERAKLKAVISEAALGLTGAVDAATAAKTGQLVGATYIVLGSITRISVRDEYRAILMLKKNTRYVEVEAEARLIEVATGLNVASAREVSAADGAEKRFFGAKMGVLPTAESLVQKALMGMGDRLGYKLAAEIPPVKK